MNVRQSVEPLENPSSPQALSGDVGGRDPALSGNPLGSAAHTLERDCGLNSVAGSILFPFFSGGCRLRTPAGPGSPLGQLGPVGQLALKNMIFIKNMMIF